MDRAIAMFISSCSDRPVIAGPRSPLPLGLGLGLEADATGASAETGSGGDFESPGLLEMGGGALGLGLGGGLVMIGGEEAVALP